MNLSSFKKKSGFTLVELLVVLAMMGILLTTLIFLMDPLKQFMKAQDALRKHDALQIKTALDTYYSDHNCYPPSVPFGGQWQEGASIYMAEVPQDPDYPESSYVYETDASKSCPQWGVLFSKLSSTQDSSVACPLAGLVNCLPTNYKSNFACSMFGNVDCNYISSNPVDFPTPTPLPTATPTPTSTPTSVPIPTLTPTPTPTPAPCSKDYACTGSPRRCNFLGTGSNSGDYCTSNCNGVCL